MNRIRSIASLLLLSGSLVTVSPKQSFAGDILENVRVELDASVSCFNICEGIRQWKVAQARQAEDKANEASLNKLININFRDLDSYKIYKQEIRLEAKKVNDVQLLAAAEVPICINNCLNRPALKACFDSCKNQHVENDAQAEAAANFADQYYLSQNLNGLIDSQTLGTLMKQVAEAVKRDFNSNETKYKTCIVSCRDTFVVSQASSLEQEIFEARAEYCAQQVSAASAENLDGAVAVSPPELTNNIRTDEDLANGALVYSTPTESLDYSDQPTAISTPDATEHDFRNLGQEGGNIAVEYSTPIETPSYYESTPSYQVDTVAYSSWYSEQNDIASAEPKVTPSLAADAERLLNYY